MIAPLSFGSTSSHPLPQNTNNECHYEQMILLNKHVCWKLSIQIMINALSRGVIGLEMLQKIMANLTESFKV